MSVSATGRSVPHLPIEAAKMTFEVPIVRARVARARKWLLVGLAIAFLCVGGCSAVAPSPSPAATQATTSPGPIIPSPSILELVGSLGKSLTIPGVATLTVKSVREWRSASEIPASGYRFIALALTVSAIGSDLGVGADALSVVDQTLAVYWPLVGGASPRFSTPATVRQGKAQSGLLTFQIPYGGNYTLRFSPTAASVGRVPLTPNRCSRGSRRPSADGATCHCQRS